MVIDLERFTKNKKAIVPITDQQGVFNQRKFQAQIQNGFYYVNFGDSITVDNTVPVDEIELSEALEKLPSLRGFVFGSDIVPQSFNTTKTKFGLSASSIPIYFLSSAPWSYIEAVQWEDNNWLFKKAILGALDVILEVKEAFESEKDLSNIKGVTPEMRYLFFLFCFERDAAKEMEHLQQLAIAEGERKRRIEEFNKTVGGRLKNSIEKAGGHLVRFTKYGHNKLEVIWTLGSEQFNSLINASTFQCVEAGFCVSSEDSKLNIGGAVLTARDYMQGRNGTVEYAVLKEGDIRNSRRSLIHKTRE